MAATVEAKVSDRSGVLRVLCVVVLLLMLAAMIYAGGITISDYSRISV